jgi:hypothetical protein
MAICYIFSLSHFIIFLKHSRCFIDTSASYTRRLRDTQLFQDSTTSTFGWLRQGAGADFSQAGPKIAARSRRGRANLSGINYGDARPSRREEPESRGIIFGKSIRAPPLRDSCIYLSVSIISYAVRSAYCSVRAARCLPFNKSPG